MNAKEQDVDNEQATDLQHEQAIADCEILDYPKDYTSPNCKKYDERSTNNPIQNIKVDKNKPA